MHCVSVVCLTLTLCSSSGAQTASEMARTCEAEAQEMAGSLSAEAQSTFRTNCSRMDACGPRCDALAASPDDMSACVQTCLRGATGTAATTVRPPLPKNAVPATKSEAQLCQQARDFRDHRLFQLWDTQQKKYALYSQGEHDQEALRLKATSLLDDEWWAGATGAQVAIEIKGFADVTSDVLQLFVPEGQLAGHSMHYAEAVARTVTSMGVLESYAKDNAQVAAGQAWSELGARYGGQLGSGAKLLMDAASYAQTKKDQEGYRETVQAQIRQINRTVLDLTEKKGQALQKMDGYQEIVRGIDMLCANSRQEAAPGPR
jgi:hypothetical protein